MDTNLLCDEVWLSTPTSPTIHSSLYKQDCQLDFPAFLEKEGTYMPNHGYLHYLQSHNLIFSRFKAIQWLIKSCRRFNLSMATLFNAANYFDRFISNMKHGHGWKNWMMELVSVACLSVASKFMDSSLPSMYEIQMEGLNYTFEPMTIQQMELILLETLEWRLSSTTAHSYVELLITIKSDDFFKCTTLQKELLVDRVTQLILGSLLDYKMVEYRPSITSISAIEEIIQSGSESSAYLTHITGIFNKNDHKEEIVKCRKIMEVIMAEGVKKCLTSPVSVLLGGRDMDIDDGHVDLSVFNIKQSDDHIHSNKKRRFYAK